MYTMLRIAQGADLFGDLVINILYIDGSFGGMLYCIFVFYTYSVPV